MVKYPIAFVIQHLKNQMLFARLLLAILLLTLSACSIRTFPLNSKSDADIARSYRAEKEYNLAIEHFRKHMQKRLSDPHRPPEENPYFYQIIIGDIYLEAENSDKALNNYELALKNQVEPEIVAHHIRQLAIWKHNHAQSDASVELLKQYRYLEELSFDSTLDNILRDIVEREQKEEARDK